MQCKPRKRENSWFALSLQVNVALCELPVHFKICSSGFSNIAAKRYIFDGEGDELDPRFLVFEYVFGWLLRRRQVLLVKSFEAHSNEGQSKVHVYCVEDLS
jgi:hypothetical protein